MKNLIKLIIPVLIFLMTIFSLLYLNEYWNSSNKKGSHESASASVSQKTIINRFPGAKPFPFEYSFSGTSNGTMQVIKTSGEDLIYDRTYTFNEYGLRKSEHLKADKARFHFIFAGCSYAFGEGLADGEAVSDIVERKTDMVNSYNLGFNGGHLAQLLFHLEKVDMKSYVREKEGVFIFVLLKTHLGRWHMRPDFLHWAPALFPVYSARSGKLQYEGFVQDHPDYKKFQHLKKMGLEHTALQIGGTIKDKDTFSDEELSEYIGAINFLKDRYLEKFPSGKFLVLVHPQSGFNEPMRVRARELLRKFNLKYIDPIFDYNLFVTDNKLTADDVYIPGDGHPSAKTNEFLAGYLLKYLLDSKMAGQTVK